MNEKAELYKAVSAIGNLLRETYYKDMEVNKEGKINIIHKNSIFTTPELEQVKRKFLKLVDDI